MRRLITALTVVLLLSVVVADARGVVQYSATDLGTLGGWSSFAFGVNNTGEVVGWAHTASNAQHAFLYSGGVMRDLGTLGTTTRSIARNVNDSGQVVGESFTGDDLSICRAFLYHDGVMQDIGTLGGSRCQAYAINNAGSIVGYSYVTGGGNDAHAYVLANGVMRDLGTLGGKFSIACGINGKDEVAGYSGVSPTGQGYNVFLYSKGAMQDCGTLGGPAAVALDVNDSGQVVGYSDTTTSRSPYSHAFLYSAGVMRDLGTFGGLRGEARGITSSGDVVGYATDASGLPRAFLYTDGAMRDLNSLIPTAAGWQLLEAFDISENGYIVGHGKNPNGQTHAFLLTPVPEPSAFVLLGMGAVGLLTFAWRRQKRLTGRQILPLAVVLACIGVAPLAAAPIQWPVSSGGNGHWYEAVNVGNPISWTQAKTAAEQAGGHLATLTSAAENSFVFHLIEAPSYWRGYQAAMPLASGPWIGGFQLAGAPEPAGGWQWVTGDPVVYQSWCPHSYGGSEPNDDVGNEDYMQFFEWGSTVPGPWWNDARDSASYPPVAYVIEYDAVPEPSTFVLLGMGAIGLLSFVWRRRKATA